ncbi:MAG: hypothetical protein OXG81_17170 [Acidobacteria bacterium]|nr:hypothetical protein [Acidobacteriota bacterium]
MGDAWLRIGDDPANPGRLGRQRLGGISATAEVVARFATGLVGPQPGLPALRAFPQGSIWT